MDIKQIGSGYTRVVNLKTPIKTLCNSTVETHASKQEPEQQQTYSNFYQMTFLDENEAHRNIHIRCVPLGAILRFSKLPPGLHREKCQVGA